MPLTRGPNFSKMPKRWSPYPDIPGPIPGAPTPTAMSPGVTPHPDEWDPRPPSMPGAFEPGGGIIVPGANAGMEPPPEGPPQNPMMPFGGRGPAPAFPGGGMPGGLVGPGGVGAPIVAGMTDFGDPNQDEDELTKAVMMAMMRRNRG